MAIRTDIQWCDSAVKPVMGCAGCELWTPRRKTCYAGQMHDRFEGINPGYAPSFNTPTMSTGRMEEAARWSDMTGTYRSAKPWLSGLPRIIFVSDMGDALSERGTIDSQHRKVNGGAVPFEFLKSEIIDAVMSSLGQRHQWLWLTKRPNRLGHFVSWLQLEHGLSVPDNLWLGTSVTRRKDLNRLASLTTIGELTTNRFASIEPLWEPVSLTDFLDDLGWVICGGESKQKGVPTAEFNLAWARSLRDECHSAGVPFFLKQLGGNVRDDERRLHLEDSGHGGEWAEWPADLRVRQLPVAHMHS